MADQASHRTHLRLGSLEFSAEGSEESVRAQWDALVALLGNEQVMALAAAPSATSGASSKDAPQRKSTENGDVEEESSASSLDVPARLSGAVDPEILRRIYVDDTRGVSLRLLPRTKSPAPDALLLLLYGYRALRNQHDVKATELTNVLRASGMRVDRIDRVLEKHRSLVTTGGRAKGKVYGLNNQGVNAAEEMLSGMV